MPLPKLIPRKVLFGNPEKTYPDISPDGRQLSYIAPFKGVLNVWVGPLGKKDFMPITRDSDRGIRDYFWAPKGDKILYVQDKGGDENWLLYSADLKTKKIKCLTPFKKVQVQVLKVDKHFPNEIVIAMNKRDERYHDVYRLNLVTEKLALAAENPGDVDGWLVDSKLQVRGKSIARPDAGFDVFVRETETSKWKKIISWDSDDALASHLISFTKDGKSLFLIDSRNTNTGRLIKLNIKGGETEVLFEDSKYDVGAVITNPDTYEIEAAIIEKDRAHTEILDKKIKKDFEKINALQKGDAKLIGKDDADKIWIVAYDTDDGPVSYYVYYRSTGEAKFLFDHRPILKKYKLAKMEPLSFKSRDGFTINGYITFPAGLPRKNLPLVMNVHGGPWVRDTWGLDVETQWLANRGYACLQINYRGSTGYGKKFVNAGDREWGGKMHDDLIDAVNWAVGKGYANPKKICIYGGSYGGYAALVGATFTPDIFCCAVDIVGPSNLITDWKSIPPYWTVWKSVIRKRIGDPETDEEFMKSRSPFFKINKIKIPILIAHGKNDPRVNLAESLQIVNAMKKKKLKYKFMLFKDEGHGFAKPKNKMKFYAAAEKFLAENLNGRFEK